MNLQKALKTFRRSPLRMAIFAAVLLFLPACKTASPNVLNHYIAVDTPAPICELKIQDKFLTPPTLDVLKLPAVLTGNETQALADAALADLEIMDWAFTGLAGEVKTAQTACEVEKARADQSRLETLEKIRQLNATKPPDKPGG